MNVVVLVGRLARDPELRYTNSQMPVCSATLAVDRNLRKDQQASDGKTADFIRLTIFGKQGEVFSQYLSKGRQVAIEGRLSTGSYQNQKGDTVYTTDVIVSRFDFIGSRNDSGSDRNYGASQGEYGQNYSSGGYSEPAYTSQENIGKSGGSDAPEGFSEIDEDDLPF